MILCFISCTSSPPFGEPCALRSLLPATGNKFSERHAERSPEQRLSEAKAGVEGRSRSTLWDAIPRLGSYVWINFILMHPLLRDHGATPFDFAALRSGLRSG
ncbi:MAG: hypothetical protein ACNA8K_01230 [Cyclonatronaceae bacterium]